MRPYILIAIVSMLILACQLGTADDSYSSKIIKVGQTDDLENLESGQEWLGLFHGDGKYLLRPTRIQLVDVEMRNTEGTYTGRMVATPGETTAPLFLVQGPHLKRRKVTTVFNGDLHLSPGENPTFQLGNGRYEFCVAGNTKNGSTSNYSLTFRKGKSKREQVLAKSEMLMETPRLYWAGDLDGDKKLDFLIDPNTGSECGNTTQLLMLSMEATDAEYVHPAAIYRIPCGC